MAIKKQAIFLSALIVILIAGLLCIKITSSTKEARQGSSNAPVMSATSSPTSNPPILNTHASSSAAVVASTTTSETKSVRVKSSSVNYTIVGKATLIQQKGTEMMVTFMTSDKVFNGKTGSIEFKQDLPRCQLNLNKSTVVEITYYPDTYSYECTRATEIIGDLF